MTFFNYGTCACSSIAVQPVSLLTVTVIRARSVDTSLLTATVINPRCACAARVTVVVLCVCLFVHDYSRTTGYEAAYERYQHLQCHKGTKIKIAILLKRLRSRDNIIVKTSEKANMPSPSINDGHAYNN